MLNVMWLFLFPLAASFLAFFFPPISGKNKKVAAVFLSLIPLTLLIYGNTNWIGSEVQYPWFSAASIDFHLAIDSLSFLFLLLTAFIIPIALLSMRSQHVQNPNLFYGLVFLLEAFLIVFFTARNLVVFTIFFEAMLIPVYFIIVLWGGEQRQRAALTFLIYMIAGSALMIAAVLALYFSTQNGTFDLSQLAKNASSGPYAPWICAIFLLAFAVKTPLFPFHAWLPDAYTLAPTAGTILLSALLSKAGIYGFLRIGLGLFPEFIKAWNPLLLSLAIAGVFYGGLNAWGQSDYKRLLAYSSLSHVNFILVGIFIWAQSAQAGAILQSLNHGITIAALFLAAGWLEERIESTAMSRTGGLAKYLPHLCWTSLIFALSSVALPGLNNFIGELLILFGLFGIYPWLTAFLGLTVILSVIYMLKWMERIYFETPIHLPKKLYDIGFREYLVAIPLIALILGIGIYPAPLLKQIETATVKTLKGKDTP